MNPVEEFLMAKHGYQTKSALDWKAMGEQSGNALAAGGVMAGIGALTAGAALGAQSLYNAATAKRDFRGMMEWNQDLHGEDQRLLNQSFRTLRQFAPDMSKDPLVSGSIIRRMVQAPQGVAGIIQESLSAQKGINHPALEAFIEGGKSRAVSDMMRGFKPFGPGHSDAEELGKLYQSKMTRDRLQADQKQEQAGMGYQKGMREVNRRRARIETENNYLNARVKNLTGAHGRLQQEHKDLQGAQAALEARFADAVARGVINNNYKP